MNQEQSKSRSLHKKLLIAMISCLLAVLGICTVMFNVIYRQTSVNVNLYSAALADKTVATVSDAYYSQYLASMQTNLHNFCNERYLELSIHAINEEYTGESDYEAPDEYRNSLLYSAEAYFETDHYVFLTYDGKTLQSYDLSSGENGSTIVNAALTDLNSDALYSSWKEKGGEYTQNGQGYVLVWENLSSHSDYQISCGLLRYNVNELVTAVKDVAAEQTGTLLDSMDELFSRNISVMIAAIISIFLLVLAVSAILSKKISDPVVSEHDMLVEVNEMKTTFLSDVSHELKTPLAAMSGYAQDAELELIQGSERTVVQEKLRRIFSEANRMALMVTQILDATRIEEGRLVLEKTPCDLDKLVRQTVETYFAVLNKNNNRLILRIPIDLPQLYADGTRLQRVFVNLISNALKHTKNGTILIKAEADAETVTVTVKDTGCGISADDLPHIWERYYKGRHSETGTGLGLFICKFIIESHGGTIGVESELSKGTAFTFQLPRTSENVQPDTADNPIERMLRKIG